ncbi:uncharacterized protein N7484_011542 [Penicillium longicatenatum]|uniref:uncharacterized protein n=1 Tax=Penicillium longicatenatum TaxID=1561947 RepID=UPI0025482BD7|nr:uncharacterized protein N7484_011542 [Penicillium longicatenatum]KAJ5631442.1 hypothetical protein N7484_011542 [Penicillium longicatenatum]
MSKSIPKVDLRQVRNETSIAAAIRTVNAAFSSDPLIQWLRPNATPWAQPDKSVWKWQYRRIQSVMAHGRVLHSASVDEMALKFPRKQKESTVSVETDVTLVKEAQSSITTGPSGGEDAGAVRVDQLVTANKKGLESAQAQYSKNSMWYLEVIAVHPSLQARGIGGGVMNSILEHVENQPIYLECTRQENIGFYESFGFQVVDEVELVDEEQNLKLWAMVRPGKASCPE